MSKVVNQDTCIQCGTCLPECPNNAIAEVDGEYRINVSLCTECSENGGESKCQTACPTEAIEDAA